MTYRKPALNIPEETTKADLEKAIQTLIDRGQVAPENVNVVVGQIIEESKERLATISIGLIPEVKEIAGKLEKDYQRSIDTLKFYKLLKEKNGRHFYTADHWQFEYGEFVMPTFAETISLLTPAQVKLYAEMQKKGLEPKLNFAPIAMNIRTFGKAIDAKRKELKINLTDTFVWDQIRDNELIYQAQSFKAREDGIKLFVTGGKSKSQMIKENNGWLIQIDSMKQNLEPEADKIKDAEGNEMTTAQKTELYLTEAREQGYQGMSYETYAIAQMEALRNKKPLEAKYWTILPESTLTNPEIVAGGSWSIGYFNLSGNFADDQFDGLRFRRSVRVSLRPKF